MSRWDTGLPGSVAISGELRINTVASCKQGADLAKGR